MRTTTATPSPDAQDFDAVHVDAIAPTPLPGGTVRVAVRFSDPDNNVTGRTTTPIAASTPPGWRVADVLATGGASQRSRIARRS